MTRRICMIAGPNGSGKTTMALALLSRHFEVCEFLNADEIARGLAPLHPESVPLTAGKLMIQRLRELLNEQKSFMFETTAAGTNYLKYLREARDKSYQIDLVYLWLAHADLAVERVAHRVAQGGHSIPEATIKRRYVSGLKNIFKHYLPLAHTALFLDNSDEHSQSIIAKTSIPSNLIIKNPTLWKILEESAHG